MVLESILNPKNAEDKPLHVFVIAVLCTFMAVFFANFLFPAQASILAVALVTIIFSNFFQKLFELEEEKEDRAASNLRHNNLIRRHLPSIYVYSAFFLGVIVAMSFVYIFVGDKNVFALQLDTIRGFAGISGNAFVDDGQFVRFLINNSQVLVLTFALSVLFGAGAVLVLSWNASVIAVYAGLVAHNIAGSGTTAYFLGVPVALSSIALHGIPEVLAYFVGGLAGGILSVGIIREEFGSKNFNLVLTDSVRFFLIAETLIIIAAIIEAA